MTAKENFSYGNYVVMAGDEIDQSRIAAEDFALLESLGVLEQEPEDNE